MISGEIADESAETANVIEQLLVDAATRAPIGLTKSLFGARCISGPETGEGKLAQQWRFCSPRT